MVAESTFPLSSALYTTRSSSDLTFKQFARSAATPEMPVNFGTRRAAPLARDGNFVLPIGRRMPLRDAAEAHALGEKGGIGKILLLAPSR